METTYKELIVADTLNKNRNLLIEDQSNNKNMQEIIIKPSNGCCALVLILSLLLTSILLTIAAGMFVAYLIEVPLITFIISIILFCGLYSNEPNSAIVLMFCGKYVGTVKKCGFFYSCPFYSLTRVPLRSETLNTPIINVNDKSGNPIRVGAVVIWKVNEVNKALFNVQDYSLFVKNQTESAIRQICCMYKYDNQNLEEVSLKSGDEVIHQALKSELSRNVQRAGIVIEDAKITEISYSTEISNLMLKKQAAEAVISAKEKIVRGAVDIVQQTIVEMERKNLCEFDKSDKARLVSNLMVVLCSDSSAVPIVNTGNP